MKPKKCKHCKCPVGKTIGNLGYCKKCIELARQAQSDMKREETCSKIYRMDTIMGVSVMGHFPDIKICGKCPDFAPDKCNAYRRFKAEGTAKKLMPGHLHVLK